MLLQMPFLYAFYRVLDIAIELRHAPWIWWVKDLSAPDRLMIMGYSVPVLVILMTIASFILQRMTPMATADPSQQRMMMFMPHHVCVHVLPSCQRHGPLLADQ